MAVEYTRELLIEICERAIEFLKVNGMIEIANQPNMALAELGSYLNVVANLKF